MRMRFNLLFDRAANRGPVTFMLVCMKWICWLVAAALATVSLLPIGLGIFIALETDWVPMRDVSPFELHRAEIATEYVEAEARRLDRLPSYLEFQDWIAHAPPELRVDGDGFNYWPEEGRYSFSWWDRDATVTWYPAGHRGSVLISPKDVFFYGSKQADLLVFFGAGVALLIGAYGLVRLGWGWTRRLRAS